MMKAFYTLFVLILLFGGPSALSAQERPDGYCGTPAGRGAWLKKYQAEPEAYRKSVDTTLYVPITIHITGSDEGAGYFGMNDLLNAFCRVNEDFASTDIQFYLAGPPIYYNRGDYHNHDSIVQGANMMFANDVPGTLNTYIVSDPAGNCGYNLPYASVAVAKSCMNANNHTWAHEIGHALSLPHPFLGWEGGVSWDGGVAHDYNNPAPTRVTYDYTLFKDTLYLDTLIIDTAWVENVARDNCTFAADGFCDTSADYLSDRWQCNGNNESNTLQTDPLGVKFRSDATLIMGYASDNCQSRFTAEQTAAMRAFLLDQRPDWLIDQPSPPQPITAQVIPSAPTTGGTAPANDVRLQWAPVAGATHYLVQLSRLPSFSPALSQYFVSDQPELLLPELLMEGRTYHWRVRPYSYQYSCTEFGPAANFVTTPAVTSTHDLADDGPWRLYPIPVERGSYLVLENNDAPTASPLQLQWQDALGRTLARWTQAVGQTTVEVPATFAAGVYYLGIVEEGRRMVRKVVVR